MKRVALYVRVSTAEQKNHGLSVDSQIEALTEYAKANGFVIAGIYNDAGISARKNYKQRPALLKLINDCKAKRVDMILFTKLDRWFRSVKDYYAVMEQIGEIPWRAIWEDYETETSSGVFKVNIMLSVAQSEADRTSERIKSIMEYKRARGDYVGQPTIGYRVENNQLLFDEEKALGILAFFMAYLEYRPLKECIDIARQNGVLIKRNNAYRILSSTTYAGVTSSGYKCPAYISMEEHNAILARKENFVRTPALCKTYIFQGVIYCGYCGRRMMCSSRKRYSNKRGDYLQQVYQCRNVIGNYQDEPCPGCGINEDILEPIVIDKIDAAISQYKAALKLSKVSNTVANAKSKIAKLEAKLKRVGERYEDGDITREEYVIKRDEIKSQIYTLQAIETPHEAPTLPNGWKEQYNLLTRENKRIFWRKTVRKIKVYKNRHIEIEV